MLALFLGVALIAAWVFVWPSSSSGDLQFNLGRVEQFPAGTVTTFVMAGGEFGVPTAFPLRVTPQPAERSSPAIPPMFHIVHLEGGELLALSAVDPHLGCTVPWRPTFRFDDREGWFRNPCHGETYDMAGHRVFGPAPRGLDRIAIKIDGGQVLVDLGAVTHDPVMPPRGYEFQTGGTLGPLNSR